MQSLRKIAVIALCAFVLVGSLGVSLSFADTSNSTVVAEIGSGSFDFTVVKSYPAKFVAFSFPEGFDSSVSVGDEFDLFNGISLRISSINTSTHSVGFYVFYGSWQIYSMSITVGTDYKLYGGVRSTGDVGLIVNNSDSNNPPQVASSFTPEYLGMSVGSSNVYTFNSSVIQSRLTLSIPAGYALRFFSSDNIDLNAFSLSVSNTWDFPHLSGSSSRYNGARYGLYTDETIIQGASADRGSFVPWVAQNANLFGRASSYSYTHSFTDYSVYPSYSYVITNPLYAVTGQQPEERYHENGAITLNLDLDRLGTVSYQLIALRAELSADSGVFTYNNVFDPASGLITGTIVSGSGDDPDDVDFGSPTPGGGNADQPPLSENTTIFGLLNTLVNYFTGFFNSAINAIQSLVSQGQSFMQVIATMFSWLPVEISSVIVAGFVILLIVGVIKVLWR